MKTYQIVNVFFFNRVLKTIILDILFWHHQPYHTIVMDIVIVYFKVAKYVMFVGSQNYAIMVLFSCKRLKKMT